MIRLLLPLLAALLLAPLAGSAEEGMWLPNEFPFDAYRQAYGEPPSQSELDHLASAAVRFSNGGSGSFVSAEGLVLTNHHVGVDCIAKLSSRERDLLAGGFTAARREDELTCPDLELFRLLGIEPVTERVKAATAAGKDSAEASRLRRAEISLIEKECSQPPTGRCEVVTLFGGAEFHLYRYRRHTDVRLAFAPEAALAHFGGDPDNFDYPRYCLDFALFRVYEDGQPFAPEHWLRWRQQAPQEGDAVLVAGHPGSTRRNYTLAQLTFIRDVLHPFSLVLQDQGRRELEAFAARGPEQARVVADQYQSVTNSLKATAGGQSGLLDPNLYAARQKAEADLKAKLAARPELAAKYGDPWADLARAYQTYRTFEPRYRLLEGELSSRSRLLGLARNLVRLAFESEKPDGERLPEYREATRPTLERRIGAAVPVYPELEEALLTAYLWRFRAQLGNIHPLVMATMGRRTPEELAREWIAATKLADPAARKALVGAGRAAMVAAEDPLLRFVAAIEPGARALRQRYDEEIDAVDVDAGSRLQALARELSAGAGYPDATFSLRFTFGRTSGYQEAGQAVPWRSDFAGMFARAEAKGGRSPWDLTPAFHAARPKLDLAGPVNFLATVDTTGGNSGSPIVNRKMEVVGVVFDGNLYTLPNRFQYAETLGRTILVDAGAMLQTLRIVYPAGHLATELEGGR